MLIFGVVLGKTAETTYPMILPPYSIPMLWDPVWMAAPTTKKQPPMKIALLRPKKSPVKAIKRAPITHPTSYISMNVLHEFGTHYNVKRHVESKEWQNAYKERSDVTINLIKVIPCVEVVTEGTHQQNLVLFQQEKNLRCLDRMGRDVEEYLQWYQFRNRTKNLPNLRVFIYILS